MSIENWEPRKAMAALVGIVAIAGAISFALSYWAAQTPRVINVNVNFGQPLHVQMDHTP